ncbi:uncharacterized protein LOC144419821 [Styela clava]
MFMDNVTTSYNQSTEHVTVNLTSEEYIAARTYKNTQWITCQVLVIFMSFVTVYIFLGMTFYGIIDKKFKSRRRDKSSILYVLVYVAVIQSLLRLGTLQVSLLTVLITIDDVICYVITNGSGFIYALNVLTVYLTLWLRQHLLYSQPNMKRLIPSHMKSLSYVCLVLIIVQNVYYIYVFGTTIKVVSNGVECVQVFDDDDKDVKIKILFSVELFLTLLSQGLLLFLFIFPLCKHIKNKKQQHKDTSLHEENSPAKKFIEPPGKAEIAESSLSDEKCSSSKNDQTCSVLVDVNRTPEYDTLKRNRLKNFANISPTAKRLVVADVVQYPSTGEGSSLANQVNQTQSSTENIQVSSEWNLADNTRTLKVPDTTETTPLQVAEVDDTITSDEVIQNEQQQTQEEKITMSDKSITEVLGRNSRRPSPILQVLKKSTVLAIITITTDFLTFGVFEILMNVSESNNIIFETYVFASVNEVNAFINNSAIFFILKDWKFILRPPTKRN